MPPRAEEIADGPDENEPAHNHQRVCEPLAAETARSTSIRRIGSRLRSLSHRSIRGRGGAVRDFRRVEVVTVGVLWGEERGGGVATTTVRWGCVFADVASHEESVLHHGDAEAGPGSVFGGVGGVEEVGEEETDDLEGGADHSVPDEAEEGTDG